MKWKDLKYFLLTLNEEELEKNVVLWREDEAVTDIEAEQLDEDQYIEEDLWGDGCMPLSEVEYILKHQSEDYPNGVNDFKKVYDKGTPILMENF